MENVSIQNPIKSPTLCPWCHQPVTSDEYFCPNCGKKLNEPPLSTGPGIQVQLYILSIIQPMICYLAYKYWPAFKYLRSKDPKAREIGIIAITLIVASTVVTFTLSYIWITQFIHSSLSSIGNLTGF